LRSDKKGVIDLPVKLMVVVLIISLSVPLLVTSVERGESNNATSAMNSEVDKIFNAVAAVHYSGTGSSRTVSVTIPDGCEIVIPGGNGSDAYSVITRYKSNETGVRYMDQPPVRFIAHNLVITGSCLLLISGHVIDGQSAVRVSVV
jgi:hypothetical protein